MWIHRIWYSIICIPTSYSIVAMTFLKCKKALCYYRDGEETFHKHSACCAGVFEKLGF